jgi:hypothetical protein
VKVGDLVQYKSGNPSLYADMIASPNLFLMNSDDVFIILKITDHKKTWHRKIILYQPNSPYFVCVSWKDKEMLEIISEAG